MRRSGLSLLLALASACTEPAPFNARVDVVERTGLEVDGGPSFMLSTSWQGFEVVKGSSTEPQLGVVRTSEGGGSMLRFKRSTRPAGNGGQLQQMSFERVDFGSDAGVDVAFLPATFCDGRPTCPTSYYANFEVAQLLSDQSLLVAVQMGSTNASAGFTPRFRLLRFSSDGGFLLNTGVETDEFAPQLSATAVPDGPFVVASSRLSVVERRGVAIELRSPETGAVMSTVSIDGAEIPDSGVGIAAVSVPNVTRLAPTRSGFLAIGQVALNRNIACGSQDSPRPGGCGQSITHAMLVKFDKAGKQLWRRDFGQEFVQPGSLFLDAAELEDGSIVATGKMEKSTGEWLSPTHGALLAHFSSDGAILHVTRLCPCVSFLQGGAYTIATNPRAASGGYEVLFRDAQGVVTAARFDLKDNVLATAPLPRKDQLQQFATTSSGWAFFIEPRPGVVELSHVEFVPR